MSIALNPTSLSQVVDDHITWFVGWHRYAFVDKLPRIEQAASLQPPSSFPAWYEGAAHALPQDQPVLERLKAHYDQLHELARLVLIKTPEGQPVALADYDSLTAKYQEFIGGIRRLERTFSVAASGLDVLTGLRTRVGMYEELAKEQARFLRTGKSFCLAMMDIDHFKNINDSFGHEAGDRVLAAVADHISQSLRMFDDAYRFGGEEFLLCLKDTDLTTGAKAAERLCENLSKLKIKLADGREVTVTASLGVSAVARNTSVAEMLQNSDQALYRAKYQGRNRVVVAPLQGDWV